jgi:hypothetical protein
VHNNILDEEVHVLYDWLHPYVPPEVAEMGVGTTEASREGPYGELDIFGTPLSMNIMEDCPPGASGINMCNK